ncbi:hypothetical protein M493_03105 [Geobacillus genomosp. 3]|uniref:Uncharacterized protein n=1 Tax=Geobacillus genomosp. 3 TaxID=1921421 RepID=S5YW59_GEOG3|nr:hypothetical protein M493_03105 [Geobacillus genomosp. 3]
MPNLWMLMVGMAQIVTLKKAKGSFHHGTEKLPYSSRAQWK